MTAHPTYLDRGDELDWVRQHVLPRHIATTPTLRTCACQWGRCGWCKQGEHAQCGSRTLAAQGRLRDDPESYITDRQDRVVGSPSVAAVWLSDRRCIWTCPCPCPPELHTGLPPQQRPPGRTGGNEAAARLQDGRPAPHVDQEPLFEVPRAL